MAMTPKSPTEKRASKTAAKPQRDKTLPIRGIFLRVRAIIEQGRVEEFFEACDEAGFKGLKGPPGLVEFTHNFIADGSLEHTDQKGKGVAKVDRFTKAVVAVSPIDC